MPAKVWTYRPPNTADFRDKHLNPSNRPRTPENLNKLL
jgi:hypothetical protein